MKLGNVVIVLGKRLVNNQLSAEGISRVEALAAKIREMPMENTALVFCGGKTQGQSISEADAMYAYFQTLNTSLAKPFPTSQILLENRSLNTFENMRNAAKVLCESGLFPLPSQAAVEVILLSNAYHLERILEIQTLMDEQGLLRVLKSQCASVGLDLHISLDIQKHISVPYPHQGPLAEAFLLLDELTTYRVYLEGVKSGAFQRDLTNVRAQPLLRAKQAINQLRALPLEMDVLQQIAEMKKAIEMTAFDESVATAERALEVFHPILTALNRRLDPESIQ
ncbi:TPA: YdcF family protein [Vibrio parahaemolyticus]|uniref:YdcF family protein n=1 Tax=Vibrio parahaemolyticus TaxID=670 RepID=UPI00111F505E|nr:YdcF family protein [Vibrio parahaemolyticus]MBE4436398.1 YdcF family protein [Vibrio parahaemolyticus]MCR9878014.1 YdcF family protein [Vibrio parahaemolyticus]MCR9896451.1 YdcF family protein [Vibrio parahaemolyticus]MCR9956326.1 YdcF family protein [Vibrio parahaemolyticus]MDF5057321.1 YdcF family protein [Vibrio parahaemolyticus]